MLTETQFILIGLSVVVSLALLYIIVAIVVAFFKGDLETTNHSDYYGLGVAFICESTTRFKTAIQVVIGHETFTAPIKRQEEIIGKVKFIGDKPVIMIGNTYNLKLDFKEHEFKVEHNQFVVGVIVNDTFIAHDNKSFAEEYERTID